MTSAADPRTSFEPAPVDVVGDAPEAPEPDVAPLVGFEPLPPLLPLTGVVLATNPDAAETTTGMGTIVALVVSAV